MTMSSQRLSLRSSTAEGGFALIGVLLLMILMSAAAVAFLNATGSETKIGGGDREDSLAYYGAEAAMEKMMVDVGLVYTAHKVPRNTDFGVVPSTCPITGVACVLPDTTLYPQPTVPGITYPTYAISFPNGVDPVSHLLTPGATDTVQSGDFAGLSAQTIPLTLTVVAQRSAGAQVSMVRNVQVALIPVFQFGVFSETDLSYFPGPDFDFAGRVHTNGNLYLAASGTLGFHDHITVVNQVIHSKLANGVDITGTRKGPVLIPSTTTAGCDFVAPAVVPSAKAGCRNLSLNAGGQVEESANSIWGQISNNPDPTGFNRFLIGASVALNAAGTGPAVPGASPLKLPFVAEGVGPIEIIRRRVPGEAQDVSDSRLYNQAQIRVLLDDGDPKISKCLTPLLKSPDDFQTVMLTNGIAVSGTTIAATGVTTDPGVGGLSLTQFGVADSGQDPNFLHSGKGTNAFPDPVSPGCLRVEYRNAAGNYVGVTQEWLHLGFARGANTTGFPANTVNPNAILILQRDSGMGKAQPNKWYPINLYDAREGERDPGTGVGITVGGVMNLVEIDVGNLRKWLDGKSPSDIPPAARSGSLVEKTSQNGYILYFSDRRGMLPNPDTWSANCAAHPTTPFVHTPPDVYLSGDYGYEDVVKPGGTLDTGEDSNENCHLDTYGAANLGDGFNSANNDPYTNVPGVQPPPPASPTPTPSSATLHASARSVSGARHALRLVNGALGNLPIVSTGVGGFTVASENPVYILGNYNATDAPGCTSGGNEITNPNFCWADAASAHSHAAVIADAVTLLSKSWNDDNSLRYPNWSSGRIPTETYYRVAIAGGKSLTFPHFSAEEDYGTDGGVHNFLRFLEKWDAPSSVTVHYRGSLVSFYYSHQATGTFKADGQVYSPPTRDFGFDLDFLDPTKMPPGTPRFQDIVNVGYQQDFTPQ